MAKVRKAVIPAAGLGTRFLPATKSQPKEMLPLIDTPAIHYVVQEALDAGIEDILLITGRGKRAIEDYFDRAVDLEEHLRNGNNDALFGLVRDIAQLVNIHFIRQKQPLGLGHAILCARQHVGNEPFAVLLADEFYMGEVPCLKQLIDCYEETQASVVAVRTVSHDEVDRYGIVSGVREKERLYRVEDMVEKPRRDQAPSTTAIMGRYILDPSIFSILERQAPGKNGEVQLTDGLRTLLGETEVYAYEIEGDRFDVGDKLGYLKATLDLALRRAELRGPLLDYLHKLVLQSSSLSGPCDSAH